MPNRQAAPAEKDITLSVNASYPRRYKERTGHDPNLAKSEGVRRVQINRENRTPLRLRRAEFPHAAFLSNLNRGNVPAPQKADGMRIIVMCPPLANAADPAIVSSPENRQTKTPTP